MSWYCIEQRLRRLSPRRSCQQVLRLCHVLGAPSVPGPGAYFRDATWWATSRVSTISSVQLEWRCSDSTVANSRSSCCWRPPGTGAGSSPGCHGPAQNACPMKLGHPAVFDWVLALIAEAGLVKGKRIGVGSPYRSHMEAGTSAVCATSCGGTRARVCRGMLPGSWPRRAVSRHPRLRTWRSLRPPPPRKVSRSSRTSVLGLVGQERPRGQDRFKMKRSWHSGSHLAYKPESLRSRASGHLALAVVTAPAAPSRRGVDTTTLSWAKTLAASRGKPRPCRSARCGADGRRSGLHV